MTLMKKVMEKVLQFTPDAKVDPLIEEKYYIGKPLGRVDGELKVSGKATFTAEYEVNDMTYAALHFSRIARGTIEAIDTAQAESLPGVLAVITYKNAPKIGKPAKFNPSSDGTDGCMMADVPVLADEKIYWNGQPIAIVVAETQDQADEAAKKILVTYIEDSAELSFSSALPKAKMPKDLMGDDPEIKIGDPEEMFSKSAVKVDNIYKTARYNHNAIEPHATVAVWEGDEKLVVFDCTQNLYGFKNTFAKMFHLKPENVDVVSPFVGGGFGGKGMLWQNSILCVAAARVVKRPVKLNLSREAVYHLIGGRTLTLQRIALGADSSGKLRCLIHTGTTASTPNTNFAEMISFPARHLYQADSFHIAQNLVNLDSVANTFMRAPGECPATFALESGIDELAHELKIDPIELRRINEPTKDPTSHHEFSSRHIMKAFDDGAKEFGWHPKPPRSQRSGKWLVGQGVAMATYPYYRFPSSAKIKVFADGTASLGAAAHEMGMGTATVQLQHFADRLGLPLSKVFIEYGHTVLPESSQAGGSAQTASIGAAVLSAAENLLVELLSMAQNFDGPLKGQKIKDVEIKDGCLRIVNTASGESFADILKKVGVNQAEALGHGPQAMEFMKYSMHSYGAQFCEVMVNSESGAVRVSRWVGSFDTGRILNPKTATSQFRGGIIMGIGMALMEETLFDERNGRIVNPSLAEYHVPVHLDIPEIKILFTDIPDPHSPMGAHGIGEIGITGAAAAVANAVFNATGKRIRDLPITMDKLLGGYEYEYATVGIG